MPPKPINCVCGKTYWVVMKGRALTCPHCGHVWDTIPSPDNQRRIGCDCEWCKRNNPEAVALLNKK